MFNKPFKKLLVSALASSVIFSSSSALATVVVFETSHGDIEVNLFDQTTPATVNNFLTYVNDGDYNNTVIHRSIKNFITQGGGFRFEGELPLTPIQANTSINNEPVWSNLRGTIAMAKLSEKPNSATNQWFFNLANNSANLDVQNGGFTAFGQVTEDGMKVVDAIAALPTCSDIPMPEVDCANIGTPGVENFVTIINITITNSSETSASELTPVANTLIKVDPVEDNNDSGGSLSWLGLFALGLTSFSRRKKVNK